MNKIKQTSILLMALLLSFSVLGCERNMDKVPDNMMKSNEENFELVLASSTFDYENTFTSRDISAAYDDSVYNVLLSDNNSSSDNPKVEISGNNIKITNSGTYVIEGSLSDGVITVDADDTDKIQLVLNGVKINNHSTSAIKILKAKKVFITLADNSINELTSPNEFVKTESDKADGVIYSKNKLTLNGSGQLNITSTQGHGIVCNDDLIVTGGSYSIQAEKHALKAEDNIFFAGGTFDIECKKDAVHCSHDTDSDKGNIYIKSTALNISAEDDGIQASGFIIIDDGEINISDCNEGIEAQKIEIFGGSINLKSNDDGLNASSGKSTDTNNEMQKNPFDGDANCYISITGGNITIDADGDGIDSNGYLQQSGGKVIVYGPENDGNAAIDYSLSAKINGGTMIAFGYSGMAQGFSSYSAQASMLINFDNNLKDKLVLFDDKNNEIISCTANKTYNSVVLSLPDITVGNHYTVSAGSQSKTIELNSISYTDKAENTKNGAFEEQPMMNRDEMPSGEPPSDMPEMPDSSESNRMHEPPFNKN